MSNRNSTAHANSIGVVAGTQRTVSITDLEPNPWNYNVQSAGVFRKLCNAIKRHGFTKPIIVRQAEPDPRKLQIVDGEHRWRAAVALGMTHVPVVDLGQLSDEHAHELTIVLNELAGEPDEARLGDLLRDIVKTETTTDLLDVMPFAAGELDAYVSTVDFQFTSLPEEDPLSTSRDNTPPIDENHRLLLSFKGVVAEEIESVAEVLGMTPAEAILAALRNNKS